MPRFGTEEKKQVRAWEQTLLEDIENSKAIPVISSKVVNDLFMGGQGELVKEYAKEVKEHLRQRPSFVPPPTVLAAPPLYFTYMQYLLSNTDGEGAVLHSDHLVQMTKFMRVVREDIKSARDLKVDYVGFLKTRFAGVVQALGGREQLLDSLREEALKVKLSEFPQRLAYPNFEEDQENPLLILSTFPFEIYLTSSYHNFIELALEAAQKRPRTEFCRWTGALQDIPSVFETNSLLNPEKPYVPSREEPLVFHLLGDADHPESLVLTEDDYLRFVIAITEDRMRALSEGVPRRDAIPLEVRGRLGRHSLLLLGYELHSWEFMILFWGLIQEARRGGSQKERSGVAVQVERSRVEKEYFEMYLREGPATYNVFWGDIHQYTRYLRDNLQ